MFEFRTKLPQGEEAADMSCEYSMYTWEAQENVKPNVVTKTEGCYVWNSKGEKRFDIGSGAVCSNIGHSQQHVRDAIKFQADRVEYCTHDNVTDVRAALSKKLLEEFAPKNMSKVIFGTGGGEMNEWALRVAKEYTGRYKILSQYNSYHGAQYGAANLTGEGWRFSSDPPISGHTHFFGPNYEDQVVGAKFESEEAWTEFLLGQLSHIIQIEGPTKIAAIFFEAITGGGGAIVPPKGYYKGVRELCDKYGILLVMDEVMAGFGRCGKNFAHEYFDVEADIITFAKGITSAYLPFGGLMVNQKIADYFAVNPAPVGCTYTAHPLSCACALATLEVFEEQKLVENSYNMGIIIEKKLKEFEETHPCIEKTRGAGLLRCYRLVKSIRENEEACNKLLKMYDDMGYCNVFFRLGNFVIAPPLTVTEEEVNMILTDTEKVLTELDKMV